MIRISHESYDKRTPSPNFPITATLQQHFDILFISSISVSQSLELLKHMVGSLTCVVAGISGCYPLQRVISVATPVSLILSWSFGQ